MMDKYTIVFYEDSKGRCLVDELLDELPPKVRAKIEKWMEKLENEGPNLPRPYADVVAGKIRELRVVFSNQYRFLYFFHGKLIVITHGFIKKTSRVPTEEIERANRMMQNFIGRYKGGENK